MIDKSADEIDEQIARCKQTPRIEPWRMLARERLDALVAIWLRGMDDEAIRDELMDFIRVDPDTRGEIILTATARDWGRRYALTHPYEPKPRYRVPPAPLPTE